jgi:PAS domain S-box-containing protein
LSDQLSPLADSDAQDLGRLYRLQVRELEDFAMFLATPDGRITTWNRGVEATFGYSEEEWVGLDARMIFVEEDRAAGIPEQEMQTAAEQGRCVDIRWHRRKDGTRVYMTGVLRGLRDENGKLIGYSKIFLDDTARKELEDALTRSNTELQQFAFVASHDLQEPVRTISSFTELLRLRCKGQLDAETDKILDFIVSGAQQLSKLISDLLAYSQLAQGEGRASSVHLDDDLETAASLLRGMVEATGALITHDPLPNVELDRNQMVRLFENLLANAIKFRKKGEPPRIHVSADRREKEWLILVTDNGIGFASEQAERIFDPFKRLHSTQEYPGSGIGLAACKRIVEQYGGRIGAESKPGEGSTFWFSVPVSVSDQERFGAPDPPLSV